jgi:hypothetical protein
MATVVREHRAERSAAGGIMGRGSESTAEVPAAARGQDWVRRVLDVWCLDLVFDVFTSGTTIKFLTIIDGGSHYCIEIVASRQLGVAEVIRALQAAIAVHGTPRHLRCDNGG